MILLDSRAGEAARSCRSATLLTVAFYLLHNIFNDFAYLATLGKRTTILLPYDAIGSEGHPCFLGLGSNSANLLDSLTILGFWRVFFVWVSVMGPGRGLVAFAGPVGALSGTRSPREKIIHARPFSLTKRYFCARLLAVSLPLVPESGLLPQSQAGYEPEALDKALENGVRACERVIFQTESLGKQVETALENMKASLGGPDALHEAERVVLVFERMTKSCTYLVKCTDELTRLRSFLAGGPDSRPDLSAKSESDLVKEVLAAIKGLGWQVTIPSSGKLIPVEA